MKKIYSTLVICITAVISFSQNIVTPASDISPLKYNWSDDNSRTGNMQTQAMNSRSDTFDILHYTIKLNITDFTTDTIRGNTKIHFTPLITNQNYIDLDLLHMRIDSIIMNSASLTWTYTDTLLRANFAVAMNTGDTSDLIVYYHGKPQIDPSGWGGFYFQSGYAYNLGVGFQTYPVNFGRAWYPCFDNFVERAPYTFIIGSAATKPAYCNGVLGADTTDVNGVRWRTWDLTETIPSYLASVAVASYTQVNWTHSGIYGSYPIILTAVPTDTTPLKNSFIHLNDALDAFENRYGPYEWPRVGYCLVPFNNGAMEHATNISYPRIAANGSLTYEADIMAHELSHHWFGDNPTCRTEPEMWLNEGWASYSEEIFTEWEYGRPAYDAAVLARHDEVVHYIHHREGGFRAVSGVPHQYTYGDHVYLKGSDVAHTLRGYMGDSLFFSSLHYYLQQEQFTDVSSTDLMNDLIASSGLNYLTDFFNDWVFNPGWPHFSIDSTVVVPNGPNYDVTVYVRQKLFGAPQYFTNVPLEFSFFKNNWQEDTVRRFISGQYTNFTVTLPFNPVYTALDLHGLISDAISDKYLVINSNGQYTYTEPKCILTVNSISDSALVRIEHNYVKPDSIKVNSNNYRLSIQRYWNIEGIFPSNFYASGRFYYDGRTTSTSGQGFWLDNDLTIPNGDSIILLYRRDASDDWHEWQHYTKFIIGSSSLSKYGYVDADSLMPGQYAFANGVSTVLIGVHELPAPAPEVVAYPNPAFRQLTIEWPGANNDPVLINIFDMNGKLVHSENVTGIQSQVEISNWTGGEYFVQVMQDGKEIGKKQVVIVH
ncbi:MAG: T9SS type A sorting domain-containing protein [Bacteroidetes bacterium]|nr:T9SS type A sorting domain-containing protein [Bacteroidota bacterium]